MVAFRHAPEPGSLAGERRQVTALFYDTVGSTELLSRTDPEEFGKMQRALHEVAARTIEKNDGYLDQVQGDGGCAYFGIPDPIEDAAESGVACALEMLEACRQLSNQLGSPIRLRIGVSTGLVILVENKERLIPGPVQIIGMAPTLASRIQSEAKPNSIAVTDDTYRLTKGAFEFEFLGQKKLKGIDNPENLWTPLTRRPLAERLRAGRRTAAPIIGRAKELEACTRSWSRALEGCGQVLAIQGDAGLGKSRLISEFRKTIGVSLAATIMLQCQPRGFRRPLHPILDQLTEIRSLPDAPGSHPATAVARTYLEQRWQSFPEVNAGPLEALLGNTQQPTANADQDAGQYLDDIRSAAIAAAVDLLIDRGDQQPRLIILEDLHWADSLTKDMIKNLCHTIESMPILIVVTSREDIPGDLATQEALHLVSLSRLDREAVSQLLLASWGDPLPTRLTEFVLAKSDGVPLFAEELGFLLRERFDATSTQREWEGFLRENQISNLSDLIAERLARLGPVRHLVNIASVIGRNFERNAIRHMIGPAVPPLDLDLALDELVRAQILAFDEAAGVYRFSHALVQESAYKNLLKSDRRTLQSRLVELAKSGAAVSLSDEQLAWHCSEAGQPFDSARYAIQAAENYAARSAIEEADHLLDFAEVQIAASDNSQIDARDLMLQLLTTRGPVYAALHGRGSDQTRAIYERGVELCGGHTDIDRSRWFPIYWGWWFTAPDYQTQRQRSEVLLHDLGKSSDPEVRLQSLHCAWATNIDAGQHRHCLTCVEEGLRLYDETRARSSRSRYGGHDAKVCGLGERAFSLWFLGDQSGSRQSIDEMLRWSEHIDHTESRVHALDYALGLELYQRNFSSVRTVALEVAELGRHEGRPGAEAKATLFGGWARVMLGDVAEGAAEFARGYAIQRDIGTEENVSLHGGMQAEIQLQLSQYHEALETLTHTINDARRSGQVFWLAELHRLRANVMNLLGSASSDVIEEFDQAIAVATQQEAVSLVRRAQADLRRVSGFDGLAFNEDLRSA